MRIALVTDAYAPARTSAAVQMRDLAQELAAQGHQPTIVAPDSSLTRQWELTDEGAVQVLRVRAPRTKDIGNARRAVAEFILPYYMWRGVSHSPLARTAWDGVAWYSPSIFLGPLVRRLKASGKCKSYLILRDLFPDWAVDTGVMKRGVAYGLLKLVQQYQFWVSDIIGVQTAANLPHVAAWIHRTYRKVEVLHNWLSEIREAGVPDFMQSTRLRGRTLFIYAGNMGVAQDMIFILKLAEILRERSDIGFIFVGRGTEAAKLRDEANRLRLTNTEFYDEVDPDLVPGLLSQCHIGIVALDPRHTTHNIPGKFVTYTQAGLAVLARINVGNDLSELIVAEDIGNAYAGDSVKEFSAIAAQLVNRKPEFSDIGLRSKEVSRRHFSVEAAARQVVAGLRK